jgi:uncharacterized protein (TIGR02996 family)
MSVLDGLLQSMVDRPACEANWLVLADWLEENDDPRRAELLRLHRKLLATCCEPGLHPGRQGWQARVVELLGQGVRPCVPQRAVVLNKRTKVTMTFAWIPPGTFLMGSPLTEEDQADDETQHRVTLAKGFWLGVQPVTQAQWRAVMGNNPSRFKGKGRPVEQVSWDDCHEFCRKLSAMTGRRCRLPTESQWEYACRAGTTTPYYTGDGLEALKRAAWCSYAGKWGDAGQTKPVGQFEPNAWGLFDMHGNVWEWCMNPHLSRGGSWRNGGDGCRAASRSHNTAGIRYDNFGCRVCLD